MKAIFIICTLIVTSVYNATVANASGLIVEKFQQSVENKLICEPDGIHREKYRQIAEKAGMRTIIFRSAASEKYIGHEGLFIKGKKSIKIFGFDLMAIYFEPENLHFQALLNAGKEQVFDIVKLKHPDAYEDPIVIEHNPDRYSPSGHRGKHMNDGGDNSNRVLFPIPIFKAPAVGGYSIEVESCEETKSKWFTKICNQFDQKPLTWMGCAITSPERFPKLER
jgi:hypothetical protein